MSKEQGRINNPFVKNPTTKATPASASTLNKADATRDNVRKQILDCLEPQTDSKLAGMKFSSEKLSSEIESIVYSLCGNNAQDRSYRDKIKKITARIKGNRNTMIRNVLKTGAITCEDFCKLEDKTLNDDNYFLKLSGGDSNDAGQNNSGQSTSQNIHQKYKSARAGVKPPSMRSFPTLSIDLSAMSELNPSDSIPEPVKEEMNENAQPSTTGPEIIQSETKPSEEESNSYAVNEMNQSEMSFQSEKQIVNIIKEETESPKETFFKPSVNVKFNPPQKKKNQNITGHNTNLTTMSETYNSIPLNQTYDLGIGDRALDTEENLNKSFSSNHNMDKLRKLQEIMAKKNEKKDPFQKGILTPRNDHLESEGVITTTKLNSNLESEKTSLGNQHPNQKSSRDEIKTQLKPEGDSNKNDTNVETNIMYNPLHYEGQISSHLMTDICSDQIGQGGQGKDHFQNKTPDEDNINLSNKYKDNSDEIKAVNELTDRQENENDNDNDNGEMFNPKTTHSNSQHSAINNVKSEENKFPNVLAPSEFNSGIKDKLRSLNESKITLEMNLETQTQKCLAYESELHNMRETVRKLKEDNLRANHLDKYIIETKTLKSNLQEIEKENSGLKQENCVLKQEVHNYKSSYQSLVEQSEKFRHEAERKFQEYQRQIESLQVRLQEKERQIIEDNRKMERTNINSENIFNPYNLDVAKQMNMDIKMKRLHQRNLSYAGDHVQRENSPQYEQHYNNDNYDPNNFTNGNPNIIEEVGSSNYLNMNGNIYDEMKDLKSDEPDIEYTDNIMVSNVNLNNSSNLHNTPLNNPQVFSTTNYNEHPSINSNTAGGNIIIEEDPQRVYNNFENEYTHHVKKSTTGEEAENKPNVDDDANNFNYVHKDGNASDHKGESGATTNIFNSQTHYQSTENEVKPEFKSSPKKENMSKQVEKGSTEGLFDDADNLLSDLCSNNTAIVSNTNKPKIPLKPVSKVTKVTNPPSRTTNPPNKRVIAANMFDDFEADDDIFEKSEGNSSKIFELLSSGKAKNVEEKGRNPFFDEL